MEVIVYSGNIGGYDTPKEQAVKIPNARYLLFTDNPVPVKGWEVIAVNDSRHQREIARDIKVNAHEWLPKHDLSIWVDHAFTLNVASKLPVTHDVTCYAHHARNCIYQELEVCRLIGHISTHDANRLLATLADLKYPKNNGLCSSGFMLRRNTKDFNMEWWSLMQEFSMRDQLTQHLAAWLTGTQIGYFQNGNVYSNPYLSKKIGHKRSNIF